MPAPDFDDPHRPGCADDAYARFARHAALIEGAWSRRFDGPPEPAVQAALDEVIDALDSGALRVATQRAVGRWQVHGWLLYAAILSLAARTSRVLHAGDLRFIDQPGKFHDLDDATLLSRHWRVMPPTTVRRGCHLGRSVVLMPSYLSIGVHIGDGAMIDGFANIGSCAQIGRRVHISTCVGIGGVAEPFQPRPVIIEDDCFIGANSSVVEGVIVEEGAVIGMGVHLGQSTRIFDRETGRTSHGRIPAGAVVVPGTLPAADGSHSVSCAVIVKRADAATRAKVGINALLRS